MKRQLSEETKKHAFFEKTNKNRKQNKKYIDNFKTLSYHIFKAKETKSKQKRMCVEGGIHILQTAVVGVGFIGAEHIEAIRRTNLATVAAI